LRTERERSGVENNMRRKTLFGTGGVIIVIIAVALGVGLGVGLSRDKDR
jgi:hypothetical protein